MAPATLPRCDLNLNAGATGLRPSNDTGSKYGRNVRRVRRCRTRRLLRDDLSPPRTSARAVGALEAWRVDQRDRPGARPSTRHHPLHDQEHGGVPPRERRRSRLALMLAERQEISRGVAAGESARAIAWRLGRAPSTITRELDRLGGRRRYRAAEADCRAWDRGRRPQRCKLGCNPALREMVAAKLEEDWSPQHPARADERARRQGAEVGRAPTRAAVSPEPTRHEHAPIARTPGHRHARASSARRPTGRAPSASYRRALRAVRDAVFGRPLPNKGSRLNLKAP